ncbi:type II toxin-antitoxin system death-on-curing family toxin [Lactiplantibacillus argentoratensis]|uniref:type II toxin-antitoxin system death-on-curing family toxin n=1 Tax=Lactiplantibacillus argentoratensis TaxID=271881 RepID=UPI003F52CFA7
MDQFNELGQLVMQDYYKKHSSLIIDKNRLASKIRRLDDLHASMLIVLDDKVVKKVLVVATELAVFPTVELVMQANSDAQKIFEEYGIYGSYGIRDEKLLDNIVEATKNSVYYGQDTIPTLLRKATVYWRKLAHYQIFSNGNKRTGLIVAALFMKLNYMNLDFKQDEMYEISKKIANDELDTDGLYDFLLKNTSLDYSRMLQQYDKQK